MNQLAAVIAVCALVPGVHCAIGWCYHQASCNDSTWPIIAPIHCNGSRQSPIDINSTSAEPDSNLTAFSFKNYSSTSALKTIRNSAWTVKVTLGSGVQISGGGLPESYDCIQFHLHWGNGSSVPGSEHTVDGKRYPMELHIVCSKSSYHRNTSLALLDPTGIAALGFLIEETSGEATPASWHNLTSYLPNITNSGDSVSMAPRISLDDLLVGVDRTKYYRYLGSLTTPNCNEAVVWTVFKDPIKVSRDLIERFSTTVRFVNNSSPFMTNVYRDLQPLQRVTTQVTSSSACTELCVCCSLALVALTLAAKDIY
ncbi:carbonic anhydrase XVb [Betta splendens]|uniref:Carbonic anhydrase n=1 Tax=Betta splendens TaxID=158456 RepID=A0A9W2XFX1_BETSP|nr:carbonic anhydrase XVb [Betta splendens]